MRWLTDRYALLIGTNSYAGLPALEAPHNDITALQDVLGDPNIGGYRVRTLLDPPLPSATREIEAFCQARVPSDAVIVYISGHGQRDDEGRLVFPLIDSEQASLQASTLSAAWLAQALRDCRSRNIVFFIDTCYSGAVSSSLPEQADRISAFDVFGGGQGFVVLTSANNRQEAFQKSDDTGSPRLSVFTYHLVQALRTGDADRNADGYVSLEELYSYLVEKVAVDEPAQIPSRAGYQEGDLQIARSRKVWSGRTSPAGGDQDSTRESLRQIYLRWVSAQTRRLDLSIIEKQFGQSTVDVRSVFSPLSTKSRLILGIRQHELFNWRIAQSPNEAADTGLASLRTSHDKLDALLDRIRAIIRSEAYRGNAYPDGDYPYDLSTADAVALWERLVLTGAPGSGKTTLARHLTVFLAESALADEAGDDLGTEYWSLPLLTPVFIRLHDLVSRSFGPVSRPVSLEDFTQYLKGYFARSGLPDAGISELVLDEFTAGRVLLVLDGLDEVPEAHSPDRRAQIVSLVELLSVVYPKTKILVTGRPHAYAGDWILPGFVHEEIAPLSTQQAEQIVLNIFLLIYPAAEGAEDQTKDFLAALTRVREEIVADSSLWSSPLLLTLMCALWLRRSDKSSVGSLPTSRGGLYREAVDLLIEKWTAKHRRSSESLSDLLQISPESLRNALERMAVICHGRLGAPQSYSPFTYGDLLDSVLTIDPTARINTFELGEFLSRRSGILVELAPNQLAFAHFSFQEHLAACWLARPDMFPAGVLELMRSVPQRWRDVVDLIAAECEWRNRSADVVTLCLGLLENGEATDDGAWVCVVVAAVITQRYLRLAMDRMSDLLLYERLRATIIHVLEAGTPSAAERAFLGRTLAELGDSRPGVGLTPAGVPDIAWSAAIPVESSTADTDDGRSVEISIYQVTRLQFGAFVSSADGYDDEQWWTRAGLDWKSRSGAPPDLTQEKWSLNWPCTGISWYEANAFTKWLSSKLDTDIRLPGSAVWQAAARGPELLEYPYGNHFDGDANNTASAGLSQPCAVGIFPRGKSPYDILDLGGNVFEWTATPWVAGTDDSSQPAEPSYLVCGASYDSRDENYIRCAHSFPRRPSSAIPQRGFRIVRPV